MATETLKRYSVEEYLAIDRGAETKSEYFDGEIFAMAGASAAHNLIVTNLARELSTALRDRPCHVFPSDMRVRIPTGLYTYPDSSVVCDAPQFEGDNQDILINPQAIFEVLSPSTERYDRGRKFEHYRQLPSMRAYIMIAQDYRSIEHFAREDDERWVLTAVSEGVLTIPSLNVTLAVAEVYAKVRFPEDEAIFE